MSNEKYAANKAAEEGDLQRFCWGRRGMLRDPDGHYVTYPEHIADRAARAGASEDARDAARFRWIEDNARTEGGGHGFTVFVPVDHEDIGCGIDQAMGKLSPASSAPVGAVPSIDTPEFQSLEATYVEALFACEDDLSAETANGTSSARAAYIAHIDQYVASQVRVARGAALIEAAELAMGCDKRATPRGIGIAIKQLKESAISHSGEESQEHEREG